MRGAATFSTDVAAEGMLYAAFVRSSEAHGTILGVDTSRADALAGVLASYTGPRLGSLRIPAPQPMAAGAFEMPVLAQQTARYVGQPIAMVVAATPALAADGAEAVEVDIDPRPAVISSLRALEGDVLVFDEAGSNVVVERSVGSKDGSIDGAVRVSVRVESPRLDPVAIEPYAAVALAEPDGSTTLWCNSGTPLFTRGGIATTLGLSDDDIRVRVGAVGGAFGQRGGFRPEHVVVVAASRELRRPVKWVAGRREQFLIGEHGRDVIHDVTITADRTGAIQGIEIDILANLGAFPHRGSFIPMTMIQHATGPYTIPDVFITARAVLTNTAPTGPYRGAGRPEAGLVIEQALDAVAAATGVASDVVRRRNFVAPNTMPVTMANGLTHDGGDYEALADRSEELLADKARFHSGRATSGRRIGTGSASFIEATAGMPAVGEYGRVEIVADGVNAYTASISSGQGHETVWPQVVADALGVDEEMVNVISGDTRYVGQGTGTFGSRSAPLGAAALSVSAAAVKQKLLKAAGAMLEADPHDLLVESGHVGVRGAPGSSVSFADAAAFAAENGEPLSAEHLFVPDHQPVASGCYGAVVSVDIETGDFDLLEMVAVDDCGVHLNPMIVGGQVHGGLGQGLGQVMFERMVYDESGQPVTTTLMDYSIPDATSLPSFTTSHLTTPSTGNPLGVKGVGEAGTIGAPPAVLAAVQSAIGAPPGGAAVLRMPLLPETVWRAAREAAAMPEAGRVATPYDDNGT